MGVLSTYLKKRKSSEQYKKLLRRNNRLLQTILDKELQETIKMVKGK